MTIEEMIQAWKNDDDAETLIAPANPVGDELSDEELLEVVGGAAGILPCLIDSCGIGATICAITI